MEWRGYIGNDTYTPPIRCDEGLINIQSVKSIYWEADQQRECVCPTKTEDAFPRYYRKKILGCNGTSGCERLTPPNNTAQRRCFTNNDPPEPVEPTGVEYIQILGSCIIGTCPCCSV